MESRYYRHWHLAKDETELNITELEYSAIRFQEAFARWIVTIGELTGSSGLKYGEHVMLHVIRMQDRPKSTATIARLINRDDMPNIQYSLRKLESEGLVRKKKEKGTKNFVYEITARGTQITDEYAKIRSEMLTRNRRATPPASTTIFEEHAHESLPTVRARPHRPALRGRADAAAARRRGAGPSGCRIDQLPGPRHPRRLLPEQAGRDSALRRRGYGGSRGRRRARIRSG
jgi:predicted MarR family transcription regulator